MYAIYIAISQYFLLSLLIFVKITICCHSMNNIIRKKMSFDIMMMLIFFHYFTYVVCIMTLHGKIILAHYNNNDTQIIWII